MFKHENNNNDMLDVCTCADPEQSVTISSRRPSSIKPLERCPLSRFSVLRAGDCGPPAWEMEDAARLSSMSWCMSTLVGHDCLWKQDRGTLTKLNYEFIIST